MEIVTIKVNLADEISQAEEPQVDALWAILKYKEIGIYRKVACMCEVLNLDFNVVLASLPQDDEGRLLDYKTRHLIHDSLMEIS
jgi:hypothetical protein